MPNKQYFETRICPRCKRDYFLIEKNVCAACGYPESNTLWYLAHPYTGKGSYVNRIENFYEVNVIAKVLLERGIHNYSPISHSHPIWEQMDKMEKEEEYKLFLGLDKTIAARCDGLILCEGWEQSKGCLIEKEWFESWGKPIKYLSRHGNFISRDVTRGDEHE